MTIDAFRTTLEAILPEGLSSAADWIGTGEACDFDEEALAMSASVDHRRNEFLCGRRLARQALGVHQPLLPDEDGLPIWPNGRIASISHSRGLCCAVAAGVDTTSCLGMDMEKTNRLSPAASKRVVHSLEADFVGEDQLRASLLFSLKEAFYKAQFPRWRTAANFKDLAIDVDLAHGIASVVELAEPFDKELQAAADRLQIRFGFCGDYVVSLCWLPA